MDVTPKLQRKGSSLSLSTRLNKKRHSESPKLKTSSAGNNFREHISNTASLQRSPLYNSNSCDDGIQCTPPHKKMALNMDENLDFSPKMFDTSFSPTCMLSQTLAIDSPEVGWKWTRHSDNITANSSVRTSGSGCPVDNGLASPVSSSTEIADNNRKKGNSYKLRSLNDVRREDQRRIMEQEIRRLENTRAEEMLKQRCARLQEQLKSSGTEEVKAGSQSGKECLKKDVVSSCSSIIEMKSQSTNQSVSNTKLLNDFLNDSDMDCFLLEATQEIESNIEAKTQTNFSNSASATQKSYLCSESSLKPHVATTPASSTTASFNKNDIPVKKETAMNSDNEKRTSFYMKFLEDDCPDDWFVSLDEVILQATQNKKPRTPLQRYKSMPTETGGNSKKFSIQKDKNDNCVVSKKTTSSEETAALSKMKRHSSTHTLSPVGTHYRSRRQL